MLCAGAEVVLAGGLLSLSLSLVWELCTLAVLESADGAGVAVAGVESADGVGAAVAGLGLAEIGAIDIVFS